MQLVSYFKKVSITVAVIVLFFSSSGCIYSAKGKDSAIDESSTKGVEFTGYVESRSYIGSKCKYIIMVNKVLNPQKADIHIGDKIYLYTEGHSVSQIEEIQKDIQRHIDKLEGNPRIRFVLHNDFKRIYIGQVSAYFWQDALEGSTADIVAEILSVEERHIRIPCPPEPRRIYLLGNYRISWRHKINAKVKLVIFDKEGCLKAGDTIEVFAYPDMLDDINNTIGKKYRFIYFDDFRYRRYYKHLIIHPWET
jgi:hypothetical protein